MSEAVKQTRRRFKAKVSKSAVDFWIKEFKNICTYWRIRGKALRLFSPEKVILKKTFFHQIPYKFQCHQAKLKMFVKDYFSGLSRYFKEIPKKCPDEMFLSGKARGSRIKLDFPVKARRKTNYACRLAGLALAMAQLFLYALALSLRTGIWLRNFVCGWFDEKDYFEFRPADIILKMEKVGEAEMRKYIRQF